MEKGYRNAKDKVRTNEEGDEHKKEYFKLGPRDRPIAKPSQRMF